MEEPKINALLSNSDEQLLAEIGYKPELKRHFSLFQVFGISFSIMAILPLILSILADGLTGGPAGCFWGWVISSMFILTLEFPCRRMEVRNPPQGVYITGLISMLQRGQRQLYLT